MGGEQGVVDTLGPCACVFGCEMVYITGVMVGIRRHAERAGKAPPRATTSRAHVAAARASLAVAHWATVQPVQLAASS
jgi:hypothetical protein